MGVRFNNKFPPSKMQLGALNTPHNHRIFSMDEGPHMLEGFGQVREALTNVGISPFGWQK